MNLFNRWESVSEKIIEYLKRDVGSRDSIVKQLLDDLQNEISPGNCDLLKYCLIHCTMRILAIFKKINFLTCINFIDGFVNIVMVLLVHILPTISIRKGKQTGRWRPSRIEVLEGCWLQIKVR